MFYTYGGGLAKTMRWLTHPWVVHRLSIYCFTHMLMIHRQLHQYFHTPVGGLLMESVKFQTIYCFSSIENVLVYTPAGGLLSNFPQGLHTCSWVTCYFVSRLHNFCWFGSIQLLGLYT